MKQTILAAAAASLLLGGCARVADSRFNPFNWFGPSQSEPVSVEVTEATQDGRLLIDQVTELAVDRTPTGAIIRAVGLPQTQGFWDAELVRVPGGAPGVATYEFRVLPPVTPNPQSTQQSREIIAGAFLTNPQLNRVRTIVVTGQRNQRSLRR